jgi:activator of 2-hydroxyglutaryl-CoA dehydratase
MLLGDFGTTWTKILDTKTGERTVVQSRETHGTRVDLATGHNARSRADVFVNELLALIQGGIFRLGPGPWTIADIGSRDIKVIRVEAGRPVAMDWNNACGALTGFTLELLGRYFNLDFGAIQPVPTGLPVTCGVLGMERLFDQVASGRPVEQAVAAFARGMASFTHAFINRPEHFYLSGGMCDNPLFLNSFPYGVRVEPLGRFLLVEGLLHEANSK